MPKKWQIIKTFFSQAVLNAIECISFLQEKKKINFYKLLLTPFLKNAFFNIRRNKFWEIEHNQSDTW